MPIHKAILIQDISEYLFIIKTPLSALILQLGFLNLITIEEVLTWIITEEIEKQHHLFCSDHIQNQHPYVQLHSKLKTMLPMAIEQLTNFYIRAPKLYDTDTMVTMKLHKQDWYIYYNTSSLTRPF